jgi:hypothetical protein
MVPEITVRLKRRQEAHEESWADKLVVGHFTRGINDGTVFFTQ